MRRIPDPVAEDLAQQCAQLRHRLAVAYEMCAAAAVAHSGNRELVDALCDVANVVKPQMAGVRS